MNILEKKYRAEFYEAKTLEPLNLMLYSFRYCSKATDQKDLLDIAIREWKGWVAKKNHLEPDTWLALRVWEVTFPGRSYLCAQRYSRRYPREELRRVRQLSVGQCEPDTDGYMIRYPDVDIAHYWDGLRNNDIG